MDNNASNIFSFQFKHFKHDVDIDVGNTNVIGDKINLFFKDIFVHPVSYEMYASGLNYISEDETNYVNLIMIPVK